jgi:hypothetical protein
LPPPPSATPAPAETTAPEVPKPEPERLRLSPRNRTEAPQAIPEPPSKANATGLDIEEEKRREFERVAIESGAVKKREGLFYVVKRGDTPNSIATRFGLPIKNIELAMKSVGKERLQVGDEIPIQEKPMWELDEKTNKNTKPKTGTVPTDDPFERVEKARKEKKVSSLNTFLPKFIA